MSIKNWEKKNKKSERLITAGGKLLPIHSLK